MFKIGPSEGGSTLGRCCSCSDCDGRLPFELRGSEAARFSFAIARDRISAGVGGLAGREEDPVDVAVEAYTSALGLALSEDMLKAQARTIGTSAQ